MNAVVGPLLHTLICGVGAGIVDRRREFAVYSNLFGRALLALHVPSGVSPLLATRAKCSMPPDSLKREAVEDFLNRFWWGKQSTCIVRYASPEEMRDRARPIGVGDDHGMKDRLREFNRGHDFYSHANMLRRQRDNIWNNSERNGRPSPFDPNQNIVLASSQSGLPDALWMVTEAQMRQVRQRAPHAVFHFGTSYIDQRFKEAQDRPHLHEEGVRLPIIDLRGGEGSLEDLVCSDKTIHVQVTDFDVPGQHVVEDHIHQGVKGVVFLVKESALTAHYATQYLAALAAVQVRRKEEGMPAADLTCVLEERVSSDEIQKYHPELSIWTVSPKQAIVMLRAPTTAFIDAREEVGIAGPKAGGGRWVFTPHQYPSTAVTHSAVRTLADQLANAGITDAIFACTHSTSKGSMAAATYRREARERGDRSPIRLYLMKPGCYAFGNTPGAVSTAEGRRFDPEEGVWK